MVCCKICSLVENKNKLLNPKLDGLQKHVGKKKALVFRPRVLVGDYYISNDSQHQRNERVHANQVPNSIVDLVVHGRKVEKRKKLSSLWQFFIS
jgi:hypothetical protein